MEVKVTIEKDKCISCGACISICPDVFEFDDNNKSSLKGGPVFGEEGCITQAAQGCPVKAIHVTVDGEQKI